MELENYLKEFKEEIDRELNIFFDYKTKEIEKYNNSKELIVMLDYLEKFILSSGKRIRPILFYFGYILGGGKNKLEILKTSIAIEFIHSYFLIHDDIMDRDDFRHGSLSVHASYKKRYQSDGQKNADHFGTSMGILTGNMSLSFGYEILLHANLSTELKNKTLNKLNKIISETLFGQVMDFSLEINKEYDLDEIFEMQKYKTAKYTIEGPLQLGAILSGAGEKLLNSLSKFAVPVGIAFQIQDDIMGVFGNEKKIGKPIGSDIIEGKKTFLIAKALEFANKEQKNILNRSLGNAKLRIEDIERIKSVIVKTGSLDFSQNMAQELIKDAKESLNSLKIKNEHKKFLNDLADFVIKRKN